MTAVIDENFNLHSWRIPGLINGMSVFKQPGITYVDSGLRCDTFNIIHITDGQKVSIQAILDAVNHYRSAQLPYCIWVCRENLSENVKTAFESLKLKQQNQEPGMVLDLNNYQPIQHPNHTNAVLGNRLRIIEEYAEIVAKNWTPIDRNVIAYYKKTASTLVDNARYVHFAIYHDDGHPVSAIELFGSNEKVVGLYGLATLEHHRGKGIGTTLMTFALNRAKEMGYQLVVLQASDDGLGIYKKLGFSVYTDFFEFA